MREPVPHHLGSTALSTALQPACLRQKQPAPSADGSKARSNKLAADSPLEGTGFEPSVPLGGVGAPLSLDLRSGDGSADCMEHALSTDGRECCHAMTSWRFSLRRIASLTFTRARWSTFGHGPGLRRQERRAAVGLGQA